MSDRALELLRSTFGYERFRPSQAEVVNHVIGGGDALVIMPTGGGKSLCYQIPALAREGVGIVVSPLIALMEDQVRALRECGVRAAFVNSTLDAEQAQAIERQALAGELEMLYIAPERLLMPRTLRLLDQARLALFAIDECHCVSQWGHDFRPEYAQLAQLGERYPHVPRIALTATADPRTRADLIEKLGLRNAREFLGGFDRPNLHYRVQPGTPARAGLLRFLGAHRGQAGIVYCLSRKRVEDTAAWLRAQGWQGLPYHAGLPAMTRAAHQAKFLYEEGIVMVATIAFGMGIDKPDVRFIAHTNLPRSLENYYQETGRAGRDGLPAETWMTYGLQDIVVMRRLIEEGAASPEHKAGEHERLDALLRYAELTTCRRQTLLAYFGDGDTGPCGNCDNCLRPPALWDATEPARMALSCAYRTGQRYGAQHLTDILLGKRTERIVNAGHDRASTFGMGKSWPEETWRTLLRQLVALGFLQPTPDALSGLRLDPRCRALLRGEESLSVARSVAPKAAPDAPRASLGNERDQALWDALRALRRQLASAQGVPPYIIFHDDTLMRLVARRPQSLDELSDVSGLGEHKRERYGEALLRVLKAH